MGSLPSTALRLASSAILLGCSGGRGGPALRPSAALPALWSTPECLIADTSAPTADTLVVIGAVPLHDEAAFAFVDCAADRQRPTFGATPAPVVVAPPVPSGADLRDILDMGLVAMGGRRPDVVVTREPDMIAYAALRGDYFTSALPWNATYVLVGARETNVLSVPSLVERTNIARDAVTADARGAAEPFRWLSDTSCVGVGTGRSSDSSPSSALPLPVIAYAADDVSARQLAERILSLAGASPRRAWITAVIGDSYRAYGKTLRIAAVPADSIRDALTTGRAVAAVVSIARDPLARCGTQGGERLPVGAVPLIDTRAHVIVRRGSGAAFLIAPDGSLHFIRPRSR